MVALLAVAAGQAYGDKVADMSRTLRSSNSYKVRLSAALYLAKSRDDRAVTALARALRRDSESTVRRVAALSLGRVVDHSTGAAARRTATRALRRASRRDRDRRVRRSARTALAAVKKNSTRPSRATARSSGPAQGIFVHVGSATDLSRRLPKEGVRALHYAVRGTLRRQAPHYKQASSPPSSSQLASQRLAGYYIGAKVAKVQIASRGNRAEVRCTVSIRVSPWDGRDGHERLVANQSASATGSGVVQTSKSNTGRAALDCAVAVAEELTSRQVVPFLGKALRAR